MCPKCIKIRSKENSCHGLLGLDTKGILGVSEEGEITELALENRGQRLRSGVQILFDKNKETRCNPISVDFNLIPSLTLCTHLPEQRP